MTRNRLAGSGRRAALCLWACSAPAASAAARGGGGGTSFVVRSRGGGGGGRRPPRSASPSFGYRLLPSPPALPSASSGSDESRGDLADPLDFYRDSLPSPVDSSPSSTWGVADDWSRLSSSSSPPPPSSSFPYSFDAADEAAGILEEQEKILSEWDSDDGGDDDAASAESEGATEENYVKSSKEEDFVEDAVEIISGHYDYDDGGVRLYDTLQSSPQKLKKDDRSEEDRRDDELTFLVRCGRSPEEFLVAQGKALPELTDEMKYDPGFLLEEADDAKRAGLPLRPAMTPFFEKAVERIFAVHSKGGDALEREGIARWMTRCFSRPFDPAVASSDESVAKKRPWKMGRKGSDEGKVKVGPYDKDVLATLSRYSNEHGSGRLTLEEFKALYLEVAWAGYVNDVVGRKIVLDRPNANRRIPSAEEGVLIPGRKNTEAMLRRASASLVWRDLEAHELFSPAEEERVRLLREMELERTASSSASSDVGGGGATVPLVDECELLDDYEDRLSHRGYGENDDEDALGAGERGRDFPRAKKERGSHASVEMASEGTTPLRVRDGEFVFVDEETCIGCTQCAQIAPSSFKMLEESGRARTYDQRSSIDVENAVMACPVNCMHRVSYDELKEMEVSRDDGDGRTDHRHFGGGRAHTPLYVSGMDSDANHKSSWYHYLKQKCHGSSSCPQRGCYDCPAYAPGGNPFFKERHERAERIRARDFMSSGEADKWRKVVEL